ncbi:MAG: YHS domain-containing protein [Niastella sp.]|nr:YHS domain-containing protein [Niastella sp.]
MKLFFICMLASGILLSCNNKVKKANDTATQTENSTSMQQAASIHLDASMVDNKKDFICGMPTSAGISDTSHYKGKVYGFCSPECKADFVKEPEKYLAEIK